MPLVKDFSRKARYLLDLGAAKPVKRRPNAISPIGQSGITPDKTDMSDKTCKSGGASDGGVAQLVRAAES